VKTLTEEEDLLVRTRFWYKEDLAGGLLINNGRLKIKWRCVSILLLFLLLLLINRKSKIIVIVFICFIFLLIHQLN